MKAVHIGVSGEDDLRIPQALHSILDIERLDKVEKLLVLVENILVEPTGVERLTLEEKDGLIHFVREIDKRKLYILF